MTASITDFGQFSSMRAGADRNDPEVLREVAGQFEALFVQTMLKNMRASELADPLFGDSDQHDMYQDMMDQQLALEMSSGRGIGLADMLVRQMGGETKSVEPTKESFSLKAVKPTSVKTTNATWSSPKEFAQDVWPHAERVAKQLNVAPEAVLAQAALETGWGEHVIQRADGGSSYNLFGIKAGAEWSGGSVARPTLEYADGVTERRTEKFRAYSNLAATFDDYAALISNSPRYGAVSNHGEDAEGFATALQEAGYATDPSYANKIGGIVRGETMQSAIRGLKNSSLTPITDVRKPDTL